MPDVPIPPPFECTLKRDQARAVVRPVGELDLKTIPEVETCLREAIAGGARHIVVDLREVTFIGSSGLRVILSWDEASRSDGFSFALVRGPRIVERVFELSGVQDRLSFVEAAD